MEGLGESDVAAIGVSHPILNGILHICYIMWLVPSRKKVIDLFGVVYYFPHILTRASTSPTQCKNRSWFCLARQNKECLAFDESLGALNLFESRIDLREYPLFLGLGCCFHVCSFLGSGNDILHFCRFVLACPNTACFNMVHSQPDKRWTINKIKVAFTVAAII